MGFSHLLFLSSSSIMATHTLVLFTSLLLFAIQAARGEFDPMQRKVYSDAGVCRAKDVQVYQFPTGFTARHIPRYTVQIVNEAWEGNAVVDVHVSCGMFASADLINPKIFRRLSPGDCLVNDGKAIMAGEIIAFDYANYPPYPLRTSSVKCL